MRMADSLPVLNTRDRSSAAALSQLIRERGALPIEVPCLAVVPLSTAQEVVDELLKAGPPLWVIVTSANGVRVLGEALHERIGREATNTLLAQVAVAAVGRRTLDALEPYCQAPRVSFVAPEANSAALGEALAASLRSAPRSRILLCRGGGADSALPMALRSLPHKMFNFSIYDVDIPELTHEEQTALESAIREFAPSRLTIMLTSVVAAENLLRHVDRYLGEMGEVVRQTRVVTIGPGTAAGLERLGFVRVETSASQTIESMAALIN